MERLLMTRKEAADALRISVDMLDVLSTHGEIRKVKIVARTYYRPQELIAYIISKEEPKKC